jgi:uncharacterized protein YprB with RNaseH-like and TPR domain
LILIALIVGFIVVWNAHTAEPEKPYLLVTKQFAAVFPMSIEKFERFQGAFQYAQMRPEIANEMFVTHNGINYSFAPQHVVYFGELRGHAYEVLAEHKGKVLINNF